MKAFEAAKGTWLDRPVADLAALQPGAHLCHFYSDEADRRRLAAGFARQAIAAGDRLLYVTHQRSPSQTAGELEHEGVPVQLPGANGQIAFAGGTEMYGQDGGRPDLEAVGARLQKAVEQARAEGFPGLRVAAEMDAVAHGPWTFDELLRWERTACHLQAATGVTSICQYDHHGLSTAQERLIAAEHTQVAVNAGPPPLAAFLATREPWGLAVVGDVDLSNREAFISAVEARLGHHDEVVVDMARLHFLDVGSLGRLFALDGRRPGEARLRLVNVPDLVRRVVGANAFPPAGVGLVR